MLHRKRAPAQHVASPCQRIRCPGRYGCRRLGSRGLRRAGRPAGRSEQAQSL